MTLTLKTDELRFEDGVRIGYAQAKREIERLTAELGDLPESQRELMAECKRLTVERDALRTFAKFVMKSWPHGYVDLGDLQDKAIELGMLKLKDLAVQELSNGSVCYERTALLMGETE